MQAEVKRFLRDANVGRPRGSILYNADGEEEIADAEANADEVEGEQVGVRVRGRSGKRKEQPGRVVDVVLSDMSAPWDQTSGFWKRSLSDPYYRMMNTTGINFKDHAGSMVCIPFLQHSLGYCLTQIRIYVLRPCYSHMIP